MTALELIFQTQRPVWAGSICDYIRFEMIPWVCVLAAAHLGMNINDSRFPTVRPVSEE